jgi:hypothetical protein
VCMDHCLIQSCDTGYVPFEPLNWYSEIFCILYILCGLATIGTALGYVGVAIMKRAHSDAWSTLGLKSTDGSDGSSLRSIMHTISRHFTRFVYLNGVQTLVSLAIIIVIISIGTVFYALAEPWTFAQCMYFSTVMVTTIAVTYEMQ